MRLIHTKRTASFNLGFYANNWGWPVGKEWEIGIDIGHHSFGIELYK